MVWLLGRSSWFLTQIDPVIGRIQRIVQLPPNTEIQLVHPTAVSPSDPVANDQARRLRTIIVLERLSIGGKHSELDMPTLHRPIEPQIILASPQVRK